jgi:hypothetical protein
MQRKLKGLDEANQCDECKRLAVEQIEVASHSTTDARMKEDGTWEETAPRFGCRNHKVVPVVILTDGTRIPFAEYHVQ